METKHQQCCVDEEVVNKISLRKLRFKFYCCCNTLREQDMKSDDEVEREKICRRRFFKRVQKVKKARKKVILLCE